MTKDEFIIKMKDLGWKNDHINDLINIKEEAEKEGIHIPFEIDLFEAPLDGYNKGVR